MDWPAHLSPTSKDLIKKLLVRDVTRRLGSLKVRVQQTCGRDLMFCPLQLGVEDVKQHKWFKGMDWDCVLQRKMVVSTLHSLLFVLISSHTPSLYGIS